MYVIEVTTVYNETQYVHCHYPADGYLVSYHSASLYKDERQANNVARDILNRANLRNEVYNYRIVKV
jgi:hypothetical protein